MWMNIWLPSGAGRNEVVTVELKSCHNVSIMRSTAVRLGNWSLSECVRVQIVTATVPMIILPGRRMMVRWSKIDDSSRT